MASTSGSISRGSKTDASVQSFIGFAGNGNSAAHARNIKCTFNWTFTLNNDGSCQLKLSNFHYESQLLNSSYQWYISILDADSSQTMGTSAPGNALATMYDSYNFGSDGSSRVDFDYWSSKELVWNCADITPYLNSNYELILYVGGCSTYSVTDPVYPVSIALNFQGDPPIVTLFDYYPWSSRASGWQSLNRDGGQQDATGLHRYSNGWQRVQNVQAGDESKNKAHRYNGTSWAKSPKDQ